MSQCRWSNRSRSVVGSYLGVLYDASIAAMIFSVGRHVNLLVFSMLSHTALEEIPSIVVRMAVFRGSWNDSVGTT